MTNLDTDFETWFNYLRINVLELSGVEFRDRDSVRDEYNNGDNMVDIANSIADEYNSYEDNA